MTVRTQQAQIIIDDYKLLMLATLALILLLIVFKWSGRDAEQVAAVEG